MARSFNSRAPRGARREDCAGYSALNSFNSRAPRGARRQHLSLVILTFVSIHVPLAEHDLANRELVVGVAGFQFTCPSRSTTALIERIWNRYTFQFTCPSRSTTCSRNSVFSNLEFQFTCPSRSTTFPPQDSRRLTAFQFTCPSRSTTTFAPPLTGI